MEIQINAFLIDTHTDSHREVIEAVSELEETVHVDDDGRYNFCQECSRIYLESSMSENELDQWLWKSGLEYIGVVETSLRNDY